MCTSFSLTCRLLIRRVYVPHPRAFQKDHVDDGASAAVEPQTAPATQQAGVNVEDTSAISAELVEAQKELAEAIRQRTAAEAAYETEHGKYEKLVKKSRDFRNEVRHVRRASRQRAGLDV